MTQLKTQKPEPHQKPDNKHHHKHIRSHNHEHCCDGHHHHEHEHEHEHEHHHGCDCDYHHHEHEHKDKGEHCCDGHHHHEHKHEHHHGCDCDYQHHEHEHHHEHGDHCGCSHASGHGGSLLDDIGCGCSSCSIAATENGNESSSAIDKIKNIPIQYRIGISILLFALGFVHFSFFLISYAVAGAGVLIAAFRRLNVLDEFFLMSIASIGAIAIGEFPEAAAVMILFEIGEYFKDKAIDKSKNAISDLLALRPKNVTVRKGENPVVVLPEEVEIGDILVVKVGERIALDGILNSPVAEINNAAITGESAPVTVESGGEILSGGVVVGHPIEVKVSKHFHDSTISKIIALVQDAKESKTGTEQFITKFAKVYTPLVVLAAITMVLVPNLIWGFEHFEEWLHRGLIFLVVSCPCALVISVPLSYFAGIGKSSSLGLLFKGSSYLDAIANADRIVFDKTGTLTTGEFEVSHTNIESSDHVGTGDTGIENDDFERHHNQSSDKKVNIWNYILEMEKGSVHPLAIAISKYAEKNRIHSEPEHTPIINKITEHPGMGLEALFSDGKDILLGNERLMQLHGIHTNNEGSGATSIFVGIDKKLIGKMELNDKIREDSAPSIRKLKSHMKTTLLSGDQKDITEHVAKQVEIEEYYGSLLPVNKYEIIQDYMSKGEKVIFVGDGINDAPVLAGATIGISMGLGGSDAAIEASDAVLMKSGISAIPTVIKVSQHTKKIVIENITLSLTIKAAVLTLSALGLANMWLAVISDVGAALIAVLNTLRITAKKIS